MMRILRELRWKYSVSRTLALILLNMYWLSFLTMQITRKLRHLSYLLIINDFLHSLSSLSCQILLLIIHVFIVAVSFGWYMLCCGKIHSHFLRGFVPIVAYLIKTYRFLLMIWFFEACIQAIMKKNQEMYVIGLASINLVMVALVGAVSIYVTLTLQFKQTDYLSLRTFKPTVVLLHYAIIVSINVFKDKEIVGLALNLLLTATTLLERFKSFEFDLLRQLDLFYVTLLGYISIGRLLHLLIGKPLTQSSMLFMQVTALFIVTSFSTRLNKYLRHRLPTKLQKSKDYQEIIRQYQIARAQRDGPLGHLYENLMIQHFVKCGKMDCRCKKFHFATELTNKLEQEIFILENLRQMEEAQTTVAAGSEIRLLEIYFYLEVANQPIKAFYEIIRLKRDKISFKEKCQLESMIEMAKLCFTQIFKSHNVQNQDLELMKLIDYQENVEALQGMIIQAIQRNIQFLRLFVGHSVKIAEVQQQTRQIQQGKQQIQALMCRLTSINSQSKALNLFNLVFYRYVEFYRSRRAEFQKLRSQQQIKKRLFDKAEVNIFSSDHGTIYIDLIEERGKIVKITRNISQFFGYNKAEMVDMNIDGFMPSIFGRCHNKFLGNFIQKGELSLLKEKQRVVFGKNKHHFIFPFNIRLKVENTNEGAFGACALVTKLKTNKQFLLCTKKGCIDEISEGFYARVFQPLLMGDVSRVSRLNILKLLPGLNLTLDSRIPQRQLIQGLLIIPIQFSQLTKFRYHRKVQNQGSSDASSDRFDRMSFNQSNQTTLSDRKDKLDQRYQQSFKSFLNQVDILQLKGFRISYRVSQVVTNYFSARVLQVQSIRQIPTDKCFFFSVLEQFRSVTNFFEINDEFSPWINKINTLQRVIKHFGISYLLEVRNGPNLVSEFEQDHSATARNLDDQRNVEFKEISVSELQPDEKEKEEVELESEVGQDSHEEGDQYRKEAMERVKPNSDQSSVLGNQEQENKKQLIIDAFSKDRAHGIPLAMVIFGVVAFGLLLFTAVGMFLGSYLKVIEQSQSWGVGCFYIMTSETLIYHTSFLQIQSYYLSQSQPASSLPTSSLQSQSTRFLSLYSTLSQQLLTVDTAHRSQLLQLPIPIKNSTFQHDTHENFFNLMHNLNTAILSLTRYDVVVENQQELQIRLNKMIQDQMKMRREKIAMIKVVSLGMFVGFEAALLVLVVVAIPIYNYFRERKLFLLRLLSYFNKRDIKKSLGMMKLLFDYMQIMDQQQKTDKIINQMQAKKNIQQQLQSQDSPRNLMMGSTLDGTVDKQDNDVRKTLKLTFEGVQDNKARFFLMLLGAVVLLSVYPISIFTFNIYQQNTIEKAISFQEKLYQFDIKVPLLVGTTLTNINRKMNGSELLPFNVSLNKNEYFEIANFLASEDWADPTKKEILTDLLTGDICKVIEDSECSTLYSGILTKGYFYTMIMFKDRLKYLLENNQEMDLSGITSWDKQNKIVQLLKLFRFLRARSLLTGQLTHQSNKNFFTNYQLTLIYIATFLAFFSLCCSWLLKRWFVQQLMEIIRGTEKIYLNFSINILTENTYLTSYFNSKVRLKI